MISWEIAGSPYPSKFLVGTKLFGQSNPVFLIDQFVGKRPLLLNEEFLSGAKIELRMWPSALMDSNLLNAIDKRVHKGVRHDGLDDFLRFVIRKRWDFNALFYYVEHFAKSQESFFIPNAIRRTEALLALHCMDEEHFLQAAGIRPNARVVEEVVSAHGLKNLAEVAEHRVRTFVGSYSRDALRSLLEATQIALMKMVLINKFELPKATPALKFKEFVTFLSQGLGVMLAREAHFAMHYFCDHAGSLLGIQSSTSGEKALKIVSSTAWDLYLLRFPEILLSDGKSDVCISYVATQEKRLHELGRLFSVQRINRGPSSHLTPEVRFDTSLLPKDFLLDVEDEFRSHSESLGVRSRLNLAVPVGLKDALELELKRRCS